MLTGAVAERLNELLYAKVAEPQCTTIHALEVLPDYLHVFVNCPPTPARHQVANQSKGSTSRVLRDAFPFLRARLPSLWSRSYDVGSAGHVSAATI